MEVFPPEYVEHNLPLVLLSGLDGHGESYATSSGARQETRTAIVTKSPECVGEKADRLLQQFLSHDGSEQPWNSASLPSPQGNLSFRMKAIGRTYSLPPRKSAPAPLVEDPNSLVAGQPRTSELHSTLSPLSPGSPIFPDGIFTTTWLTKHQDEVPALLLAFFDISADDGSAQNEQVQIDINSIRTALGRSGYKTKFAAVLMSDKSILHAPELEERLSAIRRATALDPKTGLFFMPPMSSQVEISTFVQSTLATLQPLCVEYYRDLSKHARRKKARGGPTLSASSPVMASSPSLSTSSWNVRYEMKLGVFAEFRQEMDVAERHFSAAIDELLGPEGALEAMPSWSRRWDEGRLLCDTIAVRVIRCQLWMQLKSGAVLSWVNYQARMKDLVDRRGKGSRTYGWAAWESRWAAIMAQLIQRAQLPELTPSGNHSGDEGSESRQQQAYALPEVTSERMPPFQYLHHPGYWLRIAARCLFVRRERALAIPAEDRTPPDQSPASAVAKRSNDYDVYLAPDPHEEYPLPGHKGYDYILDLQKVTNAAIHEFGLRGSARLSAQLKVAVARELIAVQRYRATMDVLLPLWNEATWREDPWLDLFREVLTILQLCARHESHAEVVVATTWELLSLGGLPNSEPGVPFQECIAGLKSNAKVALKFESMQRLSPVSLAFMFEAQECHVGERVECQLILSSEAAYLSTPIALSGIDIEMSASKLVTLKHRPAEAASEGKEVFVDMSASSEETDISLSVEVDLTIAPLQTRIFSFQLAVKEAKVVFPERITLSIDNDTFSLTQEFKGDALKKLTSLYLRQDDIIERKVLTFADTSKLMVLPKPPKLQLRLPALQEQYYTDEKMRLSVDFVNEETESIGVNAQARVESTSDIKPSLQWQGASPGASDLTLGNIALSESHSVDLILLAPSEPCTLTIHIDAKYTLTSDPATALTQTMSVEINVLAPFGTGFSFIPQLHSDRWPSSFDHSERSAGIIQQWRLETQLGSLAQGSLVIHEMRLLLENDPPGAYCGLLNRPPTKPTSIMPTRTMTSGLMFTTQRHSIDDRRSTSLELLVEVTWARSSSSDEARSVFPVPRLTLPSSEPRVLCVVAEDESSSEVLVMHYYLENPSAHFLTFALSMEANEDFAFSGPKHKALSLAPLSRHRVEYRLILHEQDELTTQSYPGEGRWIWPELQVLDSYYQKHLRVQPGGPGVRLDEKLGLGVLVRARDV